MMKLKIVTLFMSISLLSLTPLIYLGKINPLAWLDGSFDMTAITAFESGRPRNVTDAVTDKKVQVYKWRDENGVTQFSNLPPADLTAQMLVLDPDSNLVQAVVEQPLKQKSTPAQYSVDGMKKMLDDARDVEQILQQRHQQQQNMLTNI